MAPGRNGPKRTSATRRSAPAPEQAKALLRELRHDLGLARRALLVSARMLEVQNADADADVARLLRDDVAQRLDALIESTRGLIEDLERKPARPRRSRGGARS